MNENPEGTPNPLNPTPQPANTPAPGAPADAGGVATPKPPVAPAAPVAPAKPTNNTAATAENVAPVTAEQLLEPTPTAGVPVNHGAPVEPATNAAADTTPKPGPAPRPMPRGGAPRVVDPMMARGARPAMPASAPAAHPDTAVPASQDVKPPVSGGEQAQNLTDDADAIIQQLSQNTTTQPAEPVPTPKKNKKGLIALAIVFILLAIGCGVAAIIILNPFAKDDRVPVAIEKFLSGQTPSNVEAMGNIVVSNDTVEEGLSYLNINLDAKFANATGENTATAAITADFADGTELDFDADEITVEDGTSYVKLTGVADSLKKGSSGLQTTVLNSESLTTENCVDNGDGTTNCAPSDTTVQVDEVTTTCEGDACNVVQQDTLTQLGYAGLVARMFEGVDGEWIRISQSSTSDEEGIFNNTAQCLTNALSALPSQGPQIKSAYSANPFIEYSTENLGIAKVKDNLYRLSINEQKFTNFVNSLGNNSFANELLACTGGQATNDGVTLSEVTDMFNGFPTVYVEIDDQYLFTRIVFDGAFKNGSSVKADLKLSYPASVDIVEPTEYVDINVLLKAMLGDLYDITTDTTVVDGTVVENDTVVEKTTE